MGRPVAPLLAAFLAASVARDGLAGEPAGGRERTQQERWESAARDVADRVRASTIAAFESGAPASCRLHFARQGTSGTLSAADEKGIAVDCRGVRLTLPWKSLSPKHIYSLGRTYIPASDCGGRLALGIYCYVHDLPRECEDEANRVVERDGAGGAFRAEAKEVLDQLALQRAADLRRAMPARRRRRPSSGPSERRVPRGVDPSWRPMLYTKADVRECEVSFEVGFGSFRDMYGSDEGRVRADLLESVEWINETWVPEVMIHWTLKDVVIRRSAQEEPSHGRKSTSHHYKELGRIDPKLESGMLVKLTTDTGGWSLGGWYSTGVRRAVVAHKLFRQHFHHEAAHAFQQSHGCGAPYEKGSMNGSNRGPFEFVPRHHVFNFREMPGIAASPGKFGRFTKTGPYRTPVPPYARMDFAHREKGGASAARIAIDVLANDHAANNGRLWIKSFSGTKNGGAVAREAGRGPGGRDVLSYERPDGAGFEHDFFTYTVVNDFGLTSTGNVLVLFGGEKPDVEGQ